MVNGSGLWRKVGRKLSRLRWRYKLRIIRTWGAPLDRSTLQFITTDPDVNTFTYALSNQNEICDSVANILRADHLAARCFGQELVNDKVLAGRLFKRSRFRPEAKARPPLGRHTAAYCAVRLLKPTTIVESGVKHGLGSAVLLRALELNAFEGAPGQLISIDPDPESGWLVDATLHPNWHLAIADSTAALPNILRSRPAEMLISDSLPDPSTVLWELDSVLQSGCHHCLVIANHDWTDIVRSRALSRKASWGTLHEVPLNHPYPGRRIDLAYFR